MYSSQLIQLVIYVCDVGIPWLVTHGYGHWWSRSLVPLVVQLLKSDRSLGVCKTNQYNNWITNSLPHMSNFKSHIYLLSLFPIYKSIYPLSLVCMATAYVIKHILYIPANNMIWTRCYQELASNSQCNITWPQLPWQLVCMLWERLILVSTIHPHLF